MSSSPSHATVTYTSMSSDDDVPSWAHAPVYLEYLAPSADGLKPAEAQPLPTSEEPSKEEEEELSALADSPPAGLNIDLPSEVMDVSPTSDPLPSSIDALVDSWVATPTPSLPPPLPLSPLSSPLPRIPSYHYYYHHLPIEISFMRLTCRPERELDLLLHLRGSRLERVQQSLLLDSPGLLWPE
ncbi:hypothetical protein Tco_1239417, partial [Tanacetum coccineum]